MVQYMPFVISLCYNNNNAILNKSIVFVNIYVSIQMIYVQYNKHLMSIIIFNLQIHNVKL